MCEVTFGGPFSIRTRICMHRIIKLSELAKTCSQAMQVQLVSNSVHLESKVRSKTVDQRNSYGDTSASGTPYDEVAIAYIPK